MPTTTGSNPEIYIEDFKQIGIEEYFRRQENHVDQELVQLRRVGLRIANTLADIGVFDDTERLYGATKDEELLIFPHFKPRTMPRMTQEQRAVLYDDIRNGTHSKSDGNSNRTFIGLFLAKSNLDEFPVHPLIGTHSWSGNVRPIMIPEFLSLSLNRVLADSNLTHIDFAKRMEPGLATTYAWLGARTWDPMKLVQAATLPKSEQPSKIQRFRAVTSKGFLTQTGGLANPT